ncbi:leucine-rich repeat protein [Vibrio scophthalmi]|uniref:leucine-rich repeat protein n=1 Tax=Vibrio scophthalmi TaxID=45658 RepID=UPI003EBC347E
MTEAHTLTLNDVKFDKDTGAIEEYSADYKQIVIPDNFEGTPVRLIKSSAFENKSLSSVSLPESLTFIDYRSFKGNAFTTITFPQSKISISYHAFDDGVVKVVGNKNPTCLSFKNDHLNIFNDSGMITNEISVSDICSLDSLNIIADIYVKLSEKINENIANHGIQAEYSLLEYSIRVITKDGFSDESFFEHFIGHPMLELKVVNFIQNVNEWCRNQSATIWQCDDQPLAEHAAYILSMHDERYIPLYCEVILLNDMDHECYQAEHIEDLIKQYGICENTLLLIAHRLGGARGQWGINHADAHQEEMLTLFVEKPELKTFFLNTAVKSIYDSCGDDMDYFEEFLEYAADLIDGDNEKWLFSQLSPYKQ